MSAPPVFNSFRRPLWTLGDGAGDQGILRGLPRWNVDISLGKKTSVSERVSILFSFDFLNALNHVDFNTPSVSLNSRRAFGVITSQDRGPRIIQFGFRIEF